MFESSGDVDFEDDELLCGVFEEEQENINYHAKQKETHIREAHKLNSKSPDRNLSNQNLTNNCVDGIRLCSDNLLRPSHSTLGVSPCHSRNTSDFEKFKFGSTDTSENKRKLHESSPFIRNKRERKFPGPAGLLPDLKSRSPLILDKVLEDEQPNSNNMDELCSQGRCSGSVLDEEPWQNMLADLGPHRHLLDLVNVASVKRKAAARCFVGSKLPFLAAVLHYLDVSSPDPCIILRDSTGEIHGTLHRAVWEQFAGELTVGSVLVIRNVGLLSTGVSSRRHYLNITANNLATIYSANSDKFRRTRLHQLTSEDLIQTVEKWRNLASPSNGMGTPASVGSPALFNSSLSGEMNRSTISQRLSGDRIRPLQTIHGPSNMSSTPQQTMKINNPVRHPARNLLHSFPPNCSPGAITHQVHNQAKSVGDSSRIRPRSFQNSGANCSSIACPDIRQNVSSQSNNSSRVIPNTATNNFKFNPVMVKTNKLSGDNFSQSNSDRQFRTVNATYCESSAAVNNNNTKVVLSQSSQLTAEEQSMVENVFDGIDADSLFDDDF